MKRLIGFLFLCSFQVFSQTYLNILLSNNSYKYSQISELKNITFSSSGEVIYFNLKSGTTISENTANVKSFIFSNTQLGNPLPVELSSFNAVQIASSVLLKWRTETEVNNFGFDVERAENINGAMQNWNKIGFVPGNGNSNSPKDYSFTDNPAIGNKYFYRLKQIDSDGQTEFSNVISIDLNIPNKFALEQNYPNPFNPTTTITYSIPFDTDVELKIYDVLGKEVATLVKEFKDAGIHSIEFGASKLSSGVYLYRLQAGTFVQNKKMIVLK